MRTRLTGLMLGVVVFALLAACAPAARPSSTTGPSPAAAPPPAAAGPPAPAAAPAAARPAAPADDFYRGKTIRMIVGLSAGGGFDLLGRLVARHLGKHLPGNPTVIVENMTGAGGLIASNYLFNAAPADGTVLGVFTEPNLQAQLVQASGVQFDARRLHWLGSTQVQTQLCIARTDSGVTSMDDLIRGGKTLIVGTTAPGSNIHDFPAVLKGALSADFRLVSGYPGASEIALAMERNEVAGVCRPWESVKATNRDWFTGSPPYATILVQQGTERHPDLPNVPLAEELAPTPEQRQLIRAGTSTLAISKPLAAPPGVPAERVAVLRRAVEATLQDPELLREADAAKIDLSFKPGDRVQAIVNEVLNTPPDVVQRFKAILEGGA